MLMDLLLLSPSVDSERPSRDEMGGYMVSGDKNSALPSALMVPAAEVSAGLRPEELLPPLSC